ncbi:MAG: hypothetical protein ACFBSF_01145 [Leptolyngbyaceae cyanobacterium]
MTFQEIKDEVARRLGSPYTQATYIRQRCQAQKIYVRNLRYKQSWMDILTELQGMSQDSIAWLQAKKFANRFNLENLRIVQGLWTADDEGEPFTIDLHALRAT